MPFSRENDATEDVNSVLSRDDLQAMLSGINRLLASESLEDLRQVAMEVAVELIVPSSSCAWTECNMSTGYSRGCINTGEDPAMMSQAMSSVVHQHPVINAFLETGDGSARAISDIISRCHFRALDLYRCFYRKYRTEDQLCLTARVDGDWVLGLVVNRETWGFTPSEHALLQGLCPALIATYTKLRCIRELSINSNGVNLTEASRSCLVRALRAHGLTPREAEVLSRVCEGLGNRAVAVELRISEGTVRKHLDRIFLKLGVNNRTACVRAALGLIHSPVRDNSVVC